MEKELKKGKGRNMNGQVLPFEKRWKNPWVRVCQYYFRYIPTDEIYYRRRRKKKKPLNFNTQETKIGRAKAAVEAELDRRQKIASGVIPEESLKRTVREAAEDVLKKHTPKLRKRTQEKHNFFLPKLGELFGDYQLDAMTIDLFNEEIERQRRLGGRQTFMDFAKHMNLIWRHSYNRKWVKHLLRFPNPDKGKAFESRVYTKAELDRLWNAMGERLKDQFVLCYECFMRLREALYLSWDRVDLETGKITLRAQDVKTGTKTGRGREFICSPQALQRLRERAKKWKGRSPYVFPSKSDPRKPQHDNKTAWNLAKGSRKAKGNRKAGANIKGRATWHSLRHTALTEALLEKKLNATAVSEYAGVSLATIQRVYLHSKAEHTREVSQALSIGDLQNV